MSTEPISEADPVADLARLQANHDALQEQYDDVERQFEALKLMYNHLTAEKNALITAIILLGGGPRPIGEYGQSNFGNVSYG